MKKRTELQRLEDILNAEGLSRNAIRMEYETQPYLKALHYARKVAAVKGRVLIEDDFKIAWWTQ